VIRRYLKTNFRLAHPLNIKSYLSGKEKTEIYKEYVIRGRLIKYLRSDIILHPEFLKVLSLENEGKRLFTLPRGFRV